MMFVVEALPALLLAVFALFWFPDRPSQAKWLSDGERRWLAENVKGSAPEAGPVDRSDRWAALRSPVGWTCAAVWYCILASNYGLMFWLPQIVTGLSGFGGIGLILNARHSDKTGERFFHVAVPALLGGVLLLSAYLLGPGLPGLIALILGGACTGCTVAAFWAIPPQLLKPGALAMGIVIINMVGSLAGATVPPLMGLLREATGSFLWPTLLLFGIACICATLSLIARRQAIRPMQGLAPAL
jgi:MFS transporter, ACS family, tartrate transporter